MWGRVRNDLCSLKYSIVFAVVTLLLILCRAPKWGLSLTALFVIEEK